MAQNQTSNYTEQGGARTVIGGSIDVASGGDLDIESGGAFKVAATDITTELAALSGQPDLSGVTATAAEINRACDNSTRIVTATDATLAVTQALHDGKIVTLDRAGGIAVTMPEATGSGARYTFRVITAFTSDATITLADTTNTALIGGALIADSAGGVTQEMFTPGATEDLVTLDGTNTGGGLGCLIEYVDLATDVYSVNITEYVGGTVPATPFSST